MCRLVQRIQSWVASRLEARRTLDPRLEGDLARLVAQALGSTRAHDALREFCLGIGARPNGSGAYREAVAWASAWMEAGGIGKVHTEDVRVPRWLRRRESLELLEPAQRVPILGLGNSVPTPDGGLCADLVCVESFEELAALPRGRTAGRIVLFQVPSPNWEAWVHLRVLAPSAAARKGAVGALIRSFANLDPGRIRTGTVVYEFGVPSIPVAALSAEDARGLGQLLARQQRLEVRLEMECQPLPDALAANVLGQLDGRELPREVVLLTAHLDSWDVGQGALDDACGCLAILEAVRLVRELGLRPRRSLRVLLAAGGVTGAQGLKGYLQQHEGELASHAAILEADMGAAPISGFMRAPNAPGQAQDRMPVDVRALKQYLKPIGAGGFRSGVWGWDVEPMVRSGVPVLFPEQDMAGYLDLLHTNEDNVDRIPRAAFQRNVGILAAAAFLLADAPVQAPRSR